MATDINERLMEAVTFFRVDEVKECLENGADPNYFDDHEWYREDPEAQPTRPLKLVMFRISDAMLEDEQLKLYKKIAQILLEYGADPAPAMHIAEIRYGKYDPGRQSLFHDVRHVVANAMKD